MNINQALDRLRGGDAELNAIAEAIEAVMREKDTKINLLTRKVEYLSKNKCMGCIDAICDDCATEEEYLSLVLGPGTL